MLHDQRGVRLNDNVEVHEHPEQCDKCRTKCSENPDSRIHNPDFICYLKNKETRESSCWNTILRDVYLTCIEVRDILVMGYTAVEYKDSNVTCDTHWYICITIDVYTYRSMALYIDGRTKSWDNADVEIRAKQKYARVTRNTNKLEIN